MPVDYWNVTVSRNGEQILALELSMVHGVELSDEDLRAIRTAAAHLRAFAGDPHSEFAPGADDSKQ